jgi:hypothetical protein
MGRWPSEFLISEPRISRYWCECPVPDTGELHGHEVGARAAAGNPVERLDHAMQLLRIRADRASGRADSSQRRAQSV